MAAGHGAGQRPLLEQAGNAGRIRTGLVSSTARPGLSCSAMAAFWWFLRAVACQPASGVSRVLTGAKPGAKSLSSATTANGGILVIPLALNLKTVASLLLITSPCRTVTKKAVPAISPDHFS